MYKRQIRAVSVFVHVAESVLRVVNKETKTFISGPVSDGKVIIDPVVAKEVTNWRIKVTTMKNDDHVRRQVLDIQQRLIIRIVSTIGVKSLRS